MTSPAEVHAKSDAVKKLGELVGAEHQAQFRRLPLKTLEALLSKIKEPVTVVSGSGTSLGNCET